MNTCYSNVTVERTSSYKLVDTSVLVNQTQPVLLSQSHLKGKRTLCAKIALRSFGANRLLEIINNVIVTPCSISFAIRQSPDRKGHFTQHQKPQRFKG